VNASSLGEGGTYVVAAASVPASDPQATFTPTNAPRAWATNAPALPPQITLAAEDYNRMVRMIQQGLKLKMAVDLQVQFHSEAPGMASVHLVFSGDVSADIELATLQPEQVVSWMLWANQVTSVPDKDKGLLTVRYDEVFGSLNSKVKEATSC